MLSNIQNVQEFIEAFNIEYEKVHFAFEENFWATKMNLKGNSSELLTKTKNELDEFLGNQDLLEKVESFLTQSTLSDQDRTTLNCFKKTFKCYIVTDEHAKELRKKLNELEADLQTHRGNMNLGYTNSQGTFKKASSVLLRNVMSTSVNEQERRSCWEGLESIGSHVAGKFCEIIKLRNEFAKCLGYVDYYDMKVNQAEGFGKDELFRILETLKSKSKGVATKAWKSLALRKGEQSLQPWNQNFAMAGETSTLQDPYFPFENAVDCWARSFAALGITYAGATMNLDLCDREGKYSNGFCHWPQPAWKSATKGWVPSLTNFTSLATPSAVGSGHTALVTLMHEGGHAAHFSNVIQPSPLFSQERSPTSVAYAENQSMFLDSLVNDSAWLARYALDRDGNPIPWELIEKGIREGREKEIVEYACCSLL
jgi:oligoendopeptidase F